MIDLILNVIDPSGFYYNHMQINYPEIYSILMECLFKGSVLLTVVLAIMGVYAFYRIITSFCR